MQMRMNEIMEEKYKQIAEKIKDADGILIGASNGLSIAEGYNIFANDERFQSYFSDFQKKYGFRSLIQGSFSRFESENEMWSYYSRMAYYYMYHTQPSPLMQTLYALVKDKPYFVVTSNTDDHFAMAGFERQHIWELEGNMKDMQCANGCHKQIYSNREVVLTMREHEHGMEISSEYLPKCPKCGGVMKIHVPVNQNFIKGSETQMSYQNYQKFMARFQGKKLLILEFGIGARNQMIKAPFMKIAAKEPNVFYITFNKGEIYIPTQIADKAIGVDGDLSQILPQIERAYRE